MSGIPVMVYVDGETFRALEGRARREATSVRDLIVKGAQREAGTRAGHPRTDIYATHRRITPNVIDQWVAAVERGESNQSIAKRYDVSISC